MGGGPPRFVYDLAIQQVTMGHEVTVYTSDGFKKRVKVEKNTSMDVNGKNMLFQKLLPNSKI